MYTMFMYTGGWIPVHLLNVWYNWSLVIYFIPSLECVWCSMLCNKASGNLYRKNTVILFLRPLHLNQRWKEIIVAKNLSFFEHGQGRINSDMRELQCKAERRGIFFFYNWCRAGREDLSSGCFLVASFPLSIDTNAKDVRWQYYKTVWAVGPTELRDFLCGAEVNFPFRIFVFLEMTAVCRTTGVALDNS